MKKIPIKPNLILITKYFLLEYTSYLMLQFEDFKKIQKQCIKQIHFDTFENKDALYFMQKEIDKKIKQRYIFYKTVENEYFFCQLNNSSENLIDMCGATNELIKVMPQKVDITIKRYKYIKDKIKKNKTQINTNQIEI